MNIIETIKEIRGQLRRHMDGMVAAELRALNQDSGMIFGVTRNHLQLIASNYPPNKELAEELLKTSTRELHLLAFMLYPVDELTQERAKSLALSESDAGMSNFLTFDLLRHHPMANHWAERWLIEEDHPLLSTAAFLLLGRGVSLGYQLKDAELVYTKVIDVILHHQSGYNEAYTFLVRWARVQENILKKIQQDTTQYGSKTLEIILEEI